MYPSCASYSTPALARFLTQAVEDELSVLSEHTRHSQRNLARQVRALSEAYRSGPRDRPILRTRQDVAAYAVYRMPATYAATRSVLLRTVETVPDLRPHTLLDIGGGTGASLWAAADVVDTLRTAVVLDHLREALTLGRRLAARCPRAVVRDATWCEQTITSGTAVPAADLVTIAYVLGELDPRTRQALVTAAAGAVGAAGTGGTVVLVEPGTPRGFQRILDARRHLVAAGLRIVAPCPHDGTCPLSRGDDWCHVGVRLDRSALHRRVKDGSRGFEDEKVSYVVATSLRASPARARVVRRPRPRKGLVTLPLCTRDDGLRETTVSKRDSSSYRAARDTGWGDPWPPSPSPSRG
ncbi:small ribosomal subunit Rsm22 family protein [Actinopolymorpha pittospori]